MIVIDNCVRNNPLIPIPGSFSYVEIVNSNFIKFNSEAAFGVASPLAQETIVIGGRIGLMDAK